VPLPCHAAKPRTSAQPSTAQSQNRATAAAGTRPRRRSPWPAPHAGDDGGVRRVDVAQGQGEKERKADDGPEGRDKEREAMFAAWPGCAHREQVSGGEQAGERGATGRDEKRRQLRIASGAHRGPCHRQGHREDDYANEAERQATRFAAIEGRRRFGHEKPLPRQCRRAIDTRPVHLGAWHALLYRCSRRHGGR